MVRLKRTPVNYTFVRPGATEGTSFPGQFWPPPSADRLADLPSRRACDSPWNPHFLSPGKRPGSPRSRIWRPSLAAAGLPEGLRIHDLRHTCPALLIAQGAHPKAIQAQLGHSSIQVTLDRYGHLFPDDMDRLATQLDAAHEAASRRTAASVRPGAEAEVIELPHRGRKTDPDQDVSEWGCEVPADA